MRIQKKQAQLKEQQSRSIAQIKTYAHKLDDTNDLNSRMSPRNENPSQMQRLLMQVNQVDEKLKDAKTLTDSKFN